MRVEIMKGSESYRGSLGYGRASLLFLGSQSFYYYIFLQNSPPSPSSHATGLVARIKRVIILAVIDSRQPALPFRVFLLNNSGLNLHIPPLNSVNYPQQWIPSSVHFTGGGNKFHLDCVRFLRARVFQNPQFQKGCFFKTPFLPELTGFFLFLSSQPFVFICEN